jgi:hypothetical protein
MAMLHFLGSIVGHVDPSSLIHINRGRPSVRDVRLIEIKEDVRSLRQCFNTRSCPMNKSRPLKSVRLQLARSKQHPEGSQNHGYQFVAPLDAEGHIDPEAWKAHRDQCRVRRFWQGEEDQTGRLVHRPGGAEHARWMFDYDPQRDDDDESGYRFGAHKFAPGEYVSIADERGELHTFRVISVQPA